MHQRTRRALAALVIIPVLAGTAACSSSTVADSGVEETDEPVVITIMGKPAATNTAGLGALRAPGRSIRRGEPQHHHRGLRRPVGREDLRDATGRRKRAGPAACPAHRAAALIERGQVADIADVATKLESFDELNPRVMQFLERDGAVYGIPEKSYAFGLVYNRDLFEQAGLDPDAPPTTWDEVRQYAKQISETTGKTGFGEITTNNSGGWHLTGYTYTHGGEIIAQEKDGSWKAAFNDDEAREVLELWKQMRWEDDSLGDNVLGKQEDLVAEFTAGNVGMWVSAPPDVYSNYIAAGGDPDAFGAGPMPQGGADATLAGATVLMVNALATEAEKEAAVKWMEFRALRPNYDLEVAAETAEASAADGLPVGVPVLPIFSDEAYAAYREAIAEYINVPVENFDPYVGSLSELDYIPEPPVSSQEIYAALDLIVQAVLTDPNADIDSLLADAENRVNQILAQNAS